MSKILLIIQREYLYRVRAGAFILSTLGMPIVIALITLVPIAVGQYAVRGARTITVLDQSGDPGILPALARRLDGQTGLRFAVTGITVPPDKDIDEFRQEYAKQAGKGSDLAYLVLRSGVLDGAQPEYYSRSVGDLTLNKLGREIAAAITERRFVGDGADAAKVDLYLRPAALKAIKVTDSGESEQGTGMMVIAYGMVFAIYITLLIYGVTVMKGVAEEKESRIVEVVLNSVRPFELLMGKIVGIGLVGLTQYLAWVISMMTIQQVAKAILGTGGNDFLKMSPGLLAYFVIYFILGYFLFATVYAVVGAIASSNEEAMMVQLPVMGLLMLPLSVLIVVLVSPNSTGAVILSLIPFNAPILMMTRLAISNPPFWQILLSMILMVLSTVAIAWVAARIYRVAILLYGKRITITEIGRWLRYA